MAYDITTIGSIAGLITREGSKALAGMTPAEIGGIWDTVQDLYRDWSPAGLGRRAGERIRAKVEAAAQSAQEGTVFDPIPPTIELLGIPSWGPQVETALTVAAVIGVGAGTVVGYKYWRGTKKRARRSRTTRKGRPGDV